MHKWKKMYTITSFCVEKRQNIVICRLCAVLKKIAEKTNKILQPLFQVFYLVISSGTETTRHVALSDLQTALPVYDISYGIPVFSPADIFRSVSSEANRERTGPRCREL